METQAVAEAAASVCTTVCTGDAENGHAEPSEAAPTGTGTDADRSTPAAAASAVRAGSSTLAPAPGATLAAALAMIAELPLSPAEKAEAVRLLLAEHTAKGKP